MRYEERTGMDSAGRPYRRREPRLVRLCGGCLDEVAEADATAEREMDAIARDDANNRAVDAARDREFFEWCKARGKE